MSRLDEIRARHAAELALAEAEEELARAKTLLANGEIDQVTYQVAKDRARELRQASRREREGSAVASPVPVSVAAAVPSVGG